MFSKAVRIALLPHLSLRSTQMTARTTLAGSQ